jgi:hypothetical protein
VGTAKGTLLHTILWTIEGKFLTDLKSASVVHVWTISEPGHDRLFESMVRFKWKVTKETVSGFAHEGYAKNE